MLNFLYFIIFFGRNVEKAYFFIDFMFILTNFIGIIYIIIF